MLTVEELEWLRAAEARLARPIGPVQLDRIDLAWALALLRRLDREGGTPGPASDPVVREPVAKVAGAYTRGSGI